MKPEEIARLKRLADAATPGPWWAAGGYVTVRDPVSNSFTLSIYHIDEMGQRTREAPFQAVPFGKQDDAAFIAAARTAIPELIEALARVRAEAIEECAKVFVDMAAELRKRGAGRATGEMGDEFEAQRLDGFVTAIRALGGGER